MVKISCTECVERRFASSCLVLLHLPFHSVGYYPVMVIQPLANIQEKSNTGFGRIRGKEPGD